MNILKNRPVMIQNNSLSLQGKIICFHCTSSFNKYNNHLCKINLEGNGNKDTWVDLTKIYFIKTKDVIDWNRNWGFVKNQEAKKNINEFINKYFLHKAEIVNDTSVGTIIL